uniref:Gamma-secretase-activating protein C-terminal domain-containing protein n=1 Tax=Denticeps clupeoides TaxID=299321 RepID=A0AAY4EIA2_9TELE
MIQLSLTFDPRRDVFSGILEKEGHARTPEETAGAVDPRILNVERDGRVLYSWRGATGTTRVGKYDPQSKQNKLLYTFDKQVSVSSCSLNKEETLLAISLAQHTSCEERLKPVSKCLTLLIEIHPINNTKVLKAVDCRVKVQFLHCEPTQNSVLESHLLLIAEDGYVDLYHVMLARQEGYKMVMVNPDRLAKDRVAEDFFWVQWDSQTQRLFYLTCKEKCMLKCVQFYPDRNCDTLFEFPLELPANPFTSMRFVNLGFDHYLDLGIKDEGICLMVFTDEAGSLCICYSHPASGKNHFTYTTAFVHRGCSKTFTVALDQEAVPSTPQLQPLFFSLGYYLVVYLSGQFLHLINTRQQDLLCYSLFLSGPDAQLGPLGSGSAVLTLSDSTLLDVSTGRMYAADISPSFLVGCLHNSTAEAQRLAALHCMLVYKGSDPDMEMKVNRRTERGGRERAQSIGVLKDGSHAGGRVQSGDGESVCLYEECASPAALLISRCIVSAAVEHIHLKRSSLDHCACWLVYILASFAFSGTPTMNLLCSPPFRSLTGSVRMPWAPTPLIKSRSSSWELPDALTMIPGVKCTPELLPQPVFKGKARNLQGYWEELQWITERTRYFEAVPNPRYRTSQIQQEWTKILEGLQSTEKRKSSNNLRHIEDNTKKVLSMVDNWCLDKRVVPLFQEEDHQQRALIGLTADKLREHLNRHLPRLGKKKVDVLVLNYVAKLLELIRHMLESVWLKYKVDLKVLCFNHPTGAEEWAVFHVMFRILEATQGLWLPLPPGYHTLLTVLGVRCLSRHTFLQYVDHRLLQLTEPFVSRLVMDLDNSDSNEELKFSILKRLPEPMKQRIYHLWDHPVSSACISRNYVKGLLDKGTKQKEFRLEDKEQTSFRPEFLPLTYLTNILLDLEDQVLNPFEEQENVDARFVEETALKQTLIQLGFEKKHTNSVRLHEQEK